MMHPQRLAVTARRAPRLRLGCEALVDNPVCSCFYARVPVRPFSSVSWRSESRRHRRRRQRAKERKQELSKNREDEEEIVMMPVLWPRTQHDIDDANWFPKTWPDFKKDLALARKNYVETFEGFFFKEKTKEEEKIDSEVEETLNKLGEQSEQIKKNVLSNAEFVKTEGSYLVEQAKKKTGIHTADDLRMWAADMMKLATQCLSEFMIGYREGRDKEIEKVLNNEYLRDFEEFKDQVQQEIAESEEAERKRRRRKPKRRERAD